MPIANADSRELDQMHAAHGGTYGGCKEDYFALLYLTKKWGCTVADVAAKVSFGKNDYGIDAYYLDRESRNLYLFQFKWSENHNLFKESLDRLAKDGMDRIFGNPNADPAVNDLLINLRADLSEYKFLVKRVLVQMVFKGDLDAVEKSEGIRARRENVENKQYLVERFFGDEDVELRVEFISDRRQPPPPPPLRHTFSLDFTSAASVSTADGTRTMHVGFVPLIDLFDIYRTLGQQFFERNIRSGLSADNPPNAKIREALSDIVLKRKITPDVFPFNHNGVTLAVEHAAFAGGACSVKVPRLLNGAQTITSLAKFVEDNENHPALKASDSPLRQVRVLAKLVVADPASDFVANVTICNNRQNPVEPWNLRANDRVQCDLHDRLREQVGIFYARHENAFRNLTTGELEDMGYDSSRDMRIRPAAQTFLAVQGEVGRMSQLPEVFENQKWYEDTFREAYLQVDARRIVLAYKVHLCLRSPMERLDERAGEKIRYAIQRAKTWFGHC